MSEKRGFEMPTPMSNEEFDKQVAERRVKNPVKGIEMAIPMPKEEREKLEKERKERLSQGTYLKPEDLKAGMKVRMPTSEIVYEIEHVGDISGAEGAYYLRTLDGKQFGIAHFLDKNPLIKVEEETK